MRVRILRVRTRWVVYVVASKEDAEAARDWVESLGPRAFHVSANGVIRAEVDDIPRPLAELLQARRFADLRVGLDSGVVLDLQESGLTSGALRTSGASTHVGGAGVLLTDRQAAALARAVHAGYYDLPRRTDLQFLADSLGTSTSALSELLRRAEGRLVRAYLDDHPAEAVAAAREAGALAVRPAGGGRHRLDATAATR